MKTPSQTGELRVKDPELSSLTGAKYANLRLPIHIINIEVTIDGQSFTLKPLIIRVRERGRVAIKYYKRLLEKKGETMHNGLPIGVKNI